MELLEYQAKELFKMVGIPILPAQTIQDSRTIKQLQIPYPVVLKSQVRSGGRGKVGGVRFVANTIDAIAAARTIFNLAILGEYPEVILAEAHYNAEREFFLAIVLDYDLQRPVLLGSAYGGMNVDSLLANLQRVVVDTEFSLFYARRLAANMGLSGTFICSVSEIIAKMYRLFSEKDLNLIEINPLGVNSQGELMALDGKITIDNSALARQPIIKNLSFSEYQKQDNSLSTQNLEHLNKLGWRWLDWHYKTGKIAAICNSFNLALLTWDLLNQKKVTPACGIVIEDRFAELENNPQLYQARLWQILTELESIKGLKVVLINIWETETISRDFIKTIAKYIQSSLKATLHSQAEQVASHQALESNQNNSLDDRTTTKLKQQDIDWSGPKFVVRLPNQDDFAEMKLNSILEPDTVEELKTTDILYILNDLEPAIDKAIALSSN